MPPDLRTPELGARCWRNVWVLSLTIIGTITALYSWNRLTSLYLRHLGATEAQAGWGFFCFVLAYRVPQVFGGLLSARVGRKAMVVLGTFGMAACYAGIALAPSWSFLVAAHGLCWMVGALQWPSLISLVADSVAPEDRGKAVGLLEAGSMIGLTLGPFAGERVHAWLAALPATWRTLLFGTLIVYALCGAARALLLRDVRPAAEETGGGAVIPWGRLALPLVVTVLSFAVFFLTTDGPVMGFYVVDAAGGTPATVQRVAFYGGLGAVAGALLAGWLADRLGAGRTMLLTSIGTAALLAPFWRGGTSPEGELRLFALLFMPGEIYVVAYNKLIAALAPPGRRALAIGIVGTVVGLCSSWAMVAAGALYASDHRAPLAAAAALQAAACLAGLGLLRRIYN